MFTIRAERDTDSAAIETVTIEAFRTATHSSGTEQAIVRALRAADVLTVSLVAEREGEVVGHVAISPVTISSGAEHWYGLGPVSVLPALQNQGIGKALIQRALEELRTLGANGCVVLGEPEYYGRFGFQQEPSLVLPGVPPEYFQALRFRGAMPAGEVAYHKAFEAQD